MNHLTEERLILHYYGEEDCSDHLAVCDACRRDLESLSSLLDACGQLPVPEPVAGWERRVWDRVREASSRPTWWRTWRLPALAASMAALLVAAFLAGRYSHRPAPAIYALSGEASERILRSELGDHLDRSQIVLVQLTHAAREGRADIAEQQRRAGELLGENRLYRQTALLAGDNETAAVLDDLERALLSIVHSPSRLSPAELRLLQRRIDDEGILFKIRILDSNTHASEKL